MPVDCLISFINALEYNIPASVFFNEEGSEFTLVSSLDGTYVISEKETTELFSIDINVLDLAKELVVDIENNLQSWLIWPNYYEYSKKGLIERRNIVSEMLEKLKELIKLKENNFK